MPPRRNTRANPGVAEEQEVSSIRQRYAWVGPVVQPESSRLWSKRYSCNHEG
ncbi:hypothetical protein LINGRAHAP2_LOCUS30718 [Linum grandiflorum]